MSMGHIKKKTPDSSSIRGLLRAEDGTQTRDPQLGRLMLYRLSYFRIVANIKKVGSDGFEPPKA